MLTAVLVLAVAVLGLPGSRAPTGSTVPVTATGAAPAAATAGLPLRFEANRGQVDTEVLYTARERDHTTYLTADGAVFAPAAPDARPVRMRFAGADRATVAPQGQSTGTRNFLSGRDPRDWVMGVPAYDGVRYAQLYPGVDLLFGDRDGKLEYDFEVAPGADPDAVGLDFGVSRDKLAVTDDGALVVDGWLRQDAPVTYQMIDGQRRAVPSSFRVADDGRVGFTVGDYDRSATLVIDPVVDYSTYLGGGDSEGAAGIAVDGDGATYVTGRTCSSDFPTQGAVQDTIGGSDDCDAYVAKFTADGSDLVYATYLGGTDSDRGNAIALDDTGAVYVTGETCSTDFPVTAPQQASSGGECDGFVTKLPAAGAPVTYSTYLGGAADEEGVGIAVDTAGVVSVSGTTRSADFPTTAGAVQEAIAGTCPTDDEPSRPCLDAFVTQLAADGASLTYSTYLGGTRDDEAADVAVDTTGAVYVAGSTMSTDFPATAGSVQPAHAADSCPTDDDPDRPCEDAFVAKVAPGGASLAYATYLGGSTSTQYNGTPDDAASGIAVDTAGNAYVVGSAATDEFPTTAGAYQEQRTGEGDAFVTKVAPDGASLVYSTLVGGTNADDAADVAVDSSGAASITGGTSSTNFPEVDPVARHLGNTYEFAARVEADGTGLAWSTYLTGAGAVAVDAAGNTYVAGGTGSDDFPATPGAFQTQRSADSSAAFVAKLAPASGPLVTGLTPASGPASGATSVVITGVDLDGATAVSFGDVPADDFTVDSATQVTATAPAQETGDVAVTVTTADGTSPGNPVATYRYAEGVWRDAATPDDARYGQTATLLQDGRVLVAAGKTSRSGVALTTAEIYDPATDSWTPTGSMNTGRWAHTATLLPDGRVLVAGGFAIGLTTNAQPVTDTAEVWDPSTGQWTQVEALGERRALHDAVALADGRVLVAGGRTCDEPPPTACNFSFVTDSAEIFDPSTDTWSATGTMSVPRHTYSLVTLPDGRVLASPGFSSDASETADIFDPSSGTWSPTAGPPIAPRARPSAVLLPDGTVLIAAGFRAADLAEIFDPATETFAVTAPLATGRFNQYSALLPDGRALIAGGGGGGGPTAEIYNPGAQEWTSAGLMAGWHGTPSSLGHSYQAVVLSSSTDGFEADADVCGARCGAVLVVGNDNDGTPALYVPAPTASLTGPEFGVPSGGARVVIEGTGFTLGDAAVSFGATPAASVEVDSYGRLVAVAPAHAAGDVEVTVTTDGGAVTAGTFTFGDPVANVCPPPGGGDASFSDVTSGGQFESLIQCLVNYGIADGLTSTTYGPAQSVTRGEMAKFIFNLVETAAPGTLDDEAANGFSDVADDGLFENFVSALADAEIVNGFTDGTYRPGDTVLRGQMAKYIANAIEAITGSSIVGSAPDAFGDDNGGIFEAQINALAAAGIVAGDGSGNYLPSGTVTRAEMAAFIMRTAAYADTVGAWAPTKPAGQ